MGAYATLCFDVATISSTYSKISSTFHIMHLVTVRPSLTWKLSPFSILCSAIFLVAQNKVPTSVPPHFTTFHHCNPIKVAPPAKVQSTHHKQPCPHKLPASIHPHSSSTIPLPINPLILLPNVPLLLYIPPKKDSENPDAKHSRHRECNNRGRLHAAGDEERRGAS